MVTEQKRQTLNELIKSATGEELLWMSGYLAGIAYATGATETTASQSKALKSLVQKITIVYGTESGNSKKLATELASKVKSLGVAVKISSLDQYRTSNLKNETYFFVIISTHGDGEPPQAAKKFYDYLFQDGYELPALQYAVLALGDTSYPLFCKAGEDVDDRLAKHGGKRLLPLSKLDVDFSAGAQEWFSEVMALLSGEATSGAQAATATLKKNTGKKNYQGKILSTVNLNGRGSAKETYHIEIEAEDIDYAPGDAIGIIPRNPPAEVAELLSIAEASGDQTISYKNESVTLEEVLSRIVNIKYLPERLVKKYAEITGHNIPGTRGDLADLLKKYPLKNSAQFIEIISALEPITPRLYSIASALSAHPGEAHILVSRLKFTVDGQTKYGLASNYLAQLQPEQTLPFYVYKNTSFRLPAPDKDIIMIGPGTGIAPFRAFLEERDAVGATGKNWLFFGEQHFTSDFLYQTELQNWSATGLLTRVNTAFSRDQKEKIYVQDKMRQYGKDLYQWLIDGAYLYVCGSRDPMSIDVEKMLIDIICVHGNKTEAQALQMLEHFKEEKRYLKDVY